MVYWLTLRPMRYRKAGQENQKVSSRSNEDFLTQKLHILLRSKQMMMRLKTKYSTMMQLLPIMTLHMNSPLCSIGSSVNHSMKSHLELTGKGIEYSWGRAKCFYWSAKLMDKTGKANFMKLIQTRLFRATHKGGSLNIHLVHKFSWRARQYILAYYHLEHDCGKKEVDELNIENVRKQFKTHWSAIDFDEQFITHTHASNVHTAPNEQQEKTANNKLIFLKTMPSSQVVS